MQGVELLTDTFPLHLWLYKEALCAYMRLAKKLELTWTGKRNTIRRHTAHRRFWAEKVIEYDLEALLLDNDVGFARATVTNFIVNTDSFHKTAQYIQDLEKQHWTAFTDGSKVNERVGAGVVIFKDQVLWAEEKYRLPDTATVFQAELYAIRQALLLLEEVVVGTEQIQIFSDSMSALMALCSFELHSQLVARIVHKLNQIGQGTVITLYWVKAHVGIVGNEHADRLAKEGGQLNWISHVSLPRSQIRFRVLEKMRELWKQQWQEYSEARHTKLFVSQSDASRGKQIMSLNRVALRRLFLAITNHNCMRYHMNLQDDTINPTYRHCRMFDETFDHILICPYFQSHRQEHGVSWPLEDGEDWKVVSMVAFIMDKEVAQILDRYDLVPFGDSQEVESVWDSSEEEEEEIEDGHFSGMELDI